VRTAIACDWLVTQGGGERTVQAISEACPAPIHTLMYRPDACSKMFSHVPAIHSSFIQKLPFAKNKYRNYLPLFPLAMEQFDLSDYDVILSVSHAVAKGVLTNFRQLHLCYCFTPMRYAWDLTHQYLDELKGARSLAAKLSLHYLRNWDIASLNRVDHFATLSHYVAKRIQKIYGREATVIYPPVAIDGIPYEENKEEFYLTASRMVPYKRIDLIVEAFSHFPHKKLLVLGEGPEFAKIKGKASANVQFLGWRSDQELRSLMGKAKGFIFAAEEDFGIVVVEAQAAGTPVIAYGQGASLETVVKDKTGLFFEEQTVRSLCDAITEFEKRKFNPQEIRRHAQQFCESRFKQEFTQFVKEKSEAFHEIRHSSCR